MLPILRLLNRFVIKSQVTIQYSIFDIHTSQPTTMSLEAARKLSILELLRILGEKLDLEYSRVRGTPLPLEASVELVESEVRPYHFTGSRREI